MKGEKNTKHGWKTNMNREALGPGITIFMLFLLWNYFLLQSGWIGGERKKKKDRGVGCGCMGGIGLGEVSLTRGKSRARTC